MKKKKNADIRAQNQLSIIVLLSTLFVGGIFASIVFYFFPV